MAIDFFEEKKWKKSACFLYASKISMLVKRRKKNEKIDSLYEECLTIHNSMKSNSRISDISASTDLKGTDQFNLLFKEINTQENQEYLMAEFANWKVTINELKVKLKEEFADNLVTRVEKLTKVLTLIENIILMQEDAAKRIKYEKEKDEENEVADMKLSDFAIQYEKFNHFSNPDYNLYSEYAENSNLDYNNLQKLIPDLIFQVTNEIKTFLEEDAVITNKRPLNQNNLTDTNTNTIQTVKTSNDNSQGIVKPMTSKEKEEAELNILLNIDPDKLQFQIGESSSLTSHIASTFQHMLYPSSKIEILPHYNFNKMIGMEYDMNSKDFDTENVFFKVFPPVYFNDSLNKNVKFSEKDIELSKPKIKNYKPKSLKEIEESVQYNKFTPLQKNSFIWAAANFGNNPFIINEMANMFIFTQNISYKSEDVSYILSRILEEIDVNSSASSLSLLQVNHFEQPTANIEAPIQIASVNTFNYSQQLNEFINGNANVFKEYENIPNKYHLEQYSFGSVQKGNSNYVPISYISKNPLLKNQEIKRKQAKEIKEQLKRICTQVENLSNVNLSKYDYFEMRSLSPSEKPRKIINDLSSYQNIQRGKEKKLDKNTLLAQLNNDNHYETMNLRMESKRVLEELQIEFSSQPTNIMEMLSFKSTQSVAKEWESMRTPWYQNNAVFNPKFKKMVRNETRQIQTNQRLGSIH